MKMLARAGLALSAFLACLVAVPAAAVTPLPSCVRSDGVVVQCVGAMLIDQNGNYVAAGGGGGGGGGGAVTAAASSYATGFSLDVGKIADIAYTDLTGQASGGLIAINKAQVVGLNGINVTANTLFKAGQNIGNTVFGAKLQDASGTAFGTTGNPVVVSGKTDTVIQGTAANRGGIIGFSGAVISTTSASQTITLTTAPTTGAVILGQIITATGVPTGTMINALSSGTQGASGSTYTLSANATATGSSIAATSGGPQQIMAANASRRGLSEQNQGAGSCYFRDSATATADWNSLLVAAGAYYETPASYTGAGTVSEICTAAATPLYAREW